MSRRKKVKGVHLQAKGSGPLLGEKMAVEVKGTGQSGGYPIPRYKKDGFMMRFNPYPEGMIRAHIGAALGDDGIIYYPESADVDPRRATEAQALADYNNAASQLPRHREEMAAIYGDLYTKEFDRLARLKVGQSGPFSWKTK